jgi:alcohol dehydrogenase
MVPFDFQSRTRIVSGQGTFERLGQLSHNLGFTRALLVADQGIVQAGYTSAATRLLEASGIDVVPFHAFGSNPDVAVIEAGRELAAPLEIDSIVAVGGGSSLNCARAINFLLTNGGRLADYQGYGKAVTPLLPMIAVPSTAGTGSEARSYAVVADGSTYMNLVCGDPSAAARVALLDPRITITAPHHVTAMAGFEAIAHAVEAAVTMRRTPMSDTFALRAWRLLNDSFERVLLHPTDPEARASMQLGAHFAGMAIEQSMLGAADACANALTGRYKLPHGLAVAMLLPNVVRWNGGVAAERYAALLNSPRRRARDQDAADALAFRLEDLAGAAGLSLKLSDSGVDEAALPALAADAAQDWTGTFNPRPFDAAGAIEIFRASL